LHNHRNRDKIRGGYLMGVDIDCIHGDITERKNAE